MADKGLISSKQKQFIQLNSKRKIKTNNQFFKKGRRPEKTFFQRRNADGRQTHEEFNIANNQGNSNKKHDEISPHTCQNGCHQNEHK